MESTCNKSYYSGCRLASVDLKDVFFTIAVHKKYRKYFRFEHEGILYEFYSTLCLMDLDLQ